MTPIVTQAPDPRDAELEPPDTGYYVYGVVRLVRDRVPAGLTGLDGTPVTLLRGDKLAVAVGELALDRPPGRRAELVAHNDVLTALAASGPVVPMQFGSIMADEASVLSELLLPNEEYFSLLLDNLTGRSQFNLRASYHEHVVLAEVVAEDPEIARLREHTRRLPDDTGQLEKVRLGELVSRALEDKRSADAGLLLDAIAPFVVAQVPRESAGIDQLLDVALLVDDARREAFEDHLEGLAEGVHERIRLSLVGPVAPYDFVGDQ